MSPIATRITAEQYYALTVEGDHKQLVDGEIVVNEPKLIHAELQLRLAVAMRVWTAAASGRGQVFLPTDVSLDEHNVYGPDLLWVANGRVPSDLDAYPEHLPDLCVEIRSEGTWRYDIGAKKRGYEMAGLPELWLVDHAADVLLAYRRSGAVAETFDVALELSKADTLTSPQLPGFELALAEFFAR